MGSGTSGDISAQLFHHVFRILTDGNNSTSPVSGLGANGTAKFNPSMAIIIIVLISAFLFMGFFSIYVRRCTRSDDSANQNASQQAARNGANAGRPTQGLDKSVVEALPLVGYPLVKGLDGGKDLTECAVCLSDFDEEENVRLLPKCGHVFHQDCIDMWFHSHSTCPLCRASLVPMEEKEGMEGEESNMTEGFQNWVSSRGTGPNGETFTIHDGPPVPPNGSILELLSRDGADRLLAQSLRRDGPLDAGLARREGEDENTERAAGIRMLNRALSKNSNSFRRASRGLEAGERIDAAVTGSGRFNSSSVVINVDGNDAGRDNKKPRSMGSSHSFNMTLLRSSSVGSSGRYLRQYFGGQDDTDGFRSKLLGSEHKLPVGIRRERSANELSHVEIPVWEDVDLNADTGAGVSVTRTPASSTATVPGGLPFERWASRGRKFFSGELPGPAPKRMDPSEEASGPLHINQKEREPQVEERTKSERWNFGQSLRRTFSLKRTTSNTSDVESSSQQGSSNSKPYYAQPGPSAASKPKKFSPWTGAMKIRRTTSAGADGLASPHSPSAMAFPESLLVESFPLSLSVDSFPESHPVPNEQRHQHQDQSSPTEDPITILTQD